MTYEVDELAKTRRVMSIPKEEIKISPDFEYYDIQADFLNQFEVKDYKDVKKIVNTSLVKKIEASDLKSNAQNRLISELSKFYILTNTKGWTLEYNQNLVSNFDKLKNLPSLKK